MAGKEAKFFCQCCGAEVPRKSKFCPKCGKFFAAVLCPNCGHTGNTQDFINGCPQCGYAVNGHGGASGGGNASQKGINSKTKNIKMKKNQMYLPLKKSKASSDSLPLWVYAACIVVLFGLVGMLYSCL